MGVKVKHLVDLETTDIYAHGIDTARCIRLPNVPTASLPTPAANNEGAIVYDSTSNSVKFSNGAGGSWGSIAAAGGTLDGAFDLGKIIDGASSAGNAFQVGDASDKILMYAAAGACNLTTSGTSNLAIAPDGGTVAVTGAVTVSSTLAVTGNVAVNTSKFTVNATSGDVVVAGNLSVGGDLDLTGSWNLNGTLTVDELILDTDGVAPAATACYAVRDNDGDLTLNCVTGKEILLAVAGSDEYEFSATALDMNSNNVSECGFIDMSAVTINHGDNVRIGHDNSGDLVLNCKNGKEVCIAVNGTDVVQVGGSEVEIASGADIQFLGNDGILDSNGNEVILVEAVESATTYLNVKGGNAANIELEVQGAADHGITFKNDQDEELLILDPVASAVNEFTIINAATGNKPILQVSGEADIGMQVQNAAGENMLETESSATPVNWLNIGNADTGARPFIESAGEDDIGIEFQAKNNEQMLILAAVPAAVNEITITSAATGGAPSIVSSGEDNVPLIIASKGSGKIILDQKNVCGGDGANENLILESTSNATKGFVGIPTGDEGLKIGGTADRAGAVGDNALHIFDGAAAPAGALANGISLYSEGGECKVLDAAGNSTTLSPHSADGDYIIRSYAPSKGQTILIHLEKLCKKLVELHPELAEFVEVLEGDQN